MYDEHTPVMIVGGGLTGLSTSLFLSWHGVPSLLVERHPDLLIHPRARGFTPRTVELYRQVGLEPAIRAAGYASGEAFEWVAVRAETLASDEYMPADERPQDDASGNASPSPFAPIDQDKLEILLRTRAEELLAWRPDIAQEQSERVLEEALANLLSRPRRPRHHPTSGRPLILEQVPALAALRRTRRGEAT